MASEQTDVAYEMASAWNRVHPGGSTADPVDMWPYCQILAEPGLIVGQQEDLAAISIGPFRVAVARNENATRDFIEVLFPSALAALPTTQPLTAAVSGALSAVCLTFVKLLDRGVVFSRSPEDQKRWTVLIHILNCNGNGTFPTLCEVIGQVAEETKWNIRPADAEKAVTWLMDRGLVVNATQVPGGLEARI